MAWTRRSAKIYLKPDLSQIIGGIVGWGVQSALAADGKIFFKKLTRNLGKSLWPLGSDQLLLATY